MTRHILVICLLFAGCHAGDCSSCEPVNQYDQCAKACAPRKMKSFRDSKGGCVQSECICDESSASASASASAAPSASASAIDTLPALTPTLAPLPSTTPTTKDGCIVAAKDLSGDQRNLWVSECFASIDPDGEVCRTINVTCGGFFPQDRCHKSKTSWSALLDESQIRCVVGARRASQIRACDVNGVINCLDPH